MSEMAAVDPEGARLITIRFRSTDTFAEPIARGPVDLEQRPMIDDWEVSHNPVQVH